MKLHVKAKDQVIVIAGKDKGKKGSVVTAFPKTGKVIVEGVNIVTKHQKPRGQGMPGGIVHKPPSTPATSCWCARSAASPPAMAGRSMLTVPRPASAKSATNRLTDRRKRQWLPALRKST